MESCRHSFLRVDQNFVCSRCGLVDEHTEETLIDLFTKPIEIINE